MSVRNYLLTLCCLLMTGCASALPKLPTAKNVDIKRFMGPWYVIACIPTFIETKAYNAVEEYQLRPDGTIDTFFSFHKGSFDGPVKKYNPKGFIRDKTNNSTWGMQFIWPFKAEYLITYLNDDYSQTIIGRNARDYFWIMARTPEIGEEDYKSLLEMLRAQGYNMNKARKVPQQWTNTKQP